MAVEITPEIRAEVENIVFDFFSENCDIDRDKISPDSSIVEDLEGDSLMVLAILETVRKKYGITVELKTIGRHLMSKPAKTIGQIVELTLTVVKHGDNILNVAL